ncbi:MAG: hypothetical protein U0K57_09645 [Lachnospiraceae bacterium]|nr:hypothetical protein [Lachnospiraceae bacterium]
MANIKSAYAEVTAQVIEGYGGEVKGITVQIKSNQADWKSSKDAMIAGINAEKLINGAKDHVVKITYDADTDAVKLN